MKPKKAQIEKMLPAIDRKKRAATCLGDYAIEDLLPIDTTVEKVRMLDGTANYDAEISRLTGGKA